MSELGGDERGYDERIKRRRSVCRPRGNREVRGRCGSVEENNVCVYWRRKRHLRACIEGLSGAGYEEMKRDVGVPRKSRSM
jgi:hypothetical protein